MNIYNASYTGLRHDLVRHCKGQNIRLLDIGSATGATAKYLRSKGVVSYTEGVELDSCMAKESAAHMDKVVVGDIEREETFTQLGSNFDYVLLGDVLEHLKDPWALLMKLRGKLASGGTIVFSVPNTRYIDVFIHVFVKGYWPYNDRGIFDRTHIRMFTKQNIFTMVDSCDLRLDQLARNFRYRDAVGSVFPFYGPILKWAFADFYTLAPRRHEWN